MLGESIAQERAYNIAEDTRSIRVLGWKFSCVISFLFKRLRSLSSRSLAYTPNMSVA